MWQLTIEIMARLVFLRMPLRNLISEMTSAPPWCIVVRYNESPKMPAKKQRGKARKAAMPRASVTFPPELYGTLEELAKKKKVSIAWVVREAAEQYVAAEWPLFGNSFLKEKK